MIQKSTEAPLRRRVGVPVHEARLTEAFATQANKLMPPGPGRRLYIIPEPQLGRGRPDAIAITASPRGLHSYFKNSIRFTTFTQAVVVSDDNNHSVGVSDSYAKELRSSMRTDGWNDAQIKKAESIVHDSLAIEAKMTDWRRAIRQVARFRPMANRTAILMPENSASRVDKMSLKIYNSGLISASDVTLRWTVKARYQKIGTAQKLWLLELLHRHFEHQEIKSPPSCATPQDCSEVSTLVQHSSEAARFDLA